MGNKIMTVEEFVNEFLNSDDSTKLIDSIIKDEYVSFGIKNVLAKDMIEKYNIKNNKYYSDSVLMYLCYIISIINLYTTLELKEKEWDKDYDLLQRHELINMIIERIGSDVQEFRYIFEMCKEDFYKNHLSTQGFVQRQVNKVLDKVLPGLEKINTQLERIDMKKITELVKSEVMKRADK